MNTPQANPNNSDLIDLIESAEIIAVTGGRMEDDLSTHIGAYEPLAVPIIEGFWAQDDALSALLDYLHENPVNYSSHVPLLFIKSLRAFNSTQQHSCSGALIVAHALLGRGGHLKTCTIMRAMGLSIELGFLLKGIEMELVKRGADAARCITTMKDMKTMKGIHEARLLAAMKPPPANKAYKSTLKVKLLKQRLKSFVL